jgi:hypothetical protein
MNNPRNPVANVDRFMRNRHHASLRYASYDHCFNYFQEFRHRPATLARAGQRQLSCVHLGYYLASWGMFRGKAALLQHSSRALVPAVELISAAPMSILETSREENWEIDCLANVETPSNSATNYCGSSSYKDSQQLAYLTGQEHFSCCLNMVMIGSSCSDTQITVLQ